MATLMIRATLIVSLATLALAGCATPPRLSDTERKEAVLSWLDCDECFNGQFEYLTSLGPQMRPLLNAAAENEASFATLLANRRQDYFERVRPAVARQFGIPDLSTASEYEIQQVNIRANELADFYIEGDKRRHAQRARRAIRHLSRRNPEPVGEGP